MLQCLLSLACGLIFDPDSLSSHRLIGFRTVASDPQHKRRGRHIPPSRSRGQRYLRGLFIALSGGRSLVSSLCKVHAADGLTRDLSFQ